MGTWQEWLAEQRAKSMMFVEEVGLDRTLPNWAMRVVNGFLRFCSLKNEEGDRTPTFFSFAGFRISTAGREVSGWKQPLLVEIGEGAVVLVMNEHEQFLVAAKAEPGNASEGFILLAPTIHASASNLGQVHGGKRPPRAELMDGREITWIRFCQDGARFYHKVNQYAVLVVRSEEVGELMPNERWFSRLELCEAVLKGNCNDHLRQALALARAMHLF